MPKAEPLTADAMDVPQITPKAATESRAAKPKASPPHVVRMPLQVRLPRAEVKAIKLAAVQNDQTVSEFMLACFHAYMKRGKT